MEEIKVEETTTNREQPVEQVNSQAATAEQENIQGENNELNEGSLNKFKDTDNLIKAYKNLQAEFTRKSQKLSVALKQLEQNDTAKNAPVFNKENYEELLNEFVSSNPSSKIHADEISKAIKNDTSLASAKDPFSLAWAKVLVGKNKSPEDYMSDSDFINNYVINNKDIEAKIIENYLASLITKKTTPLISSHTGSAFSLTPKNKPKNLVEAYEVAKSFFKI